MSEVQKILLTFEKNAVDAWKEDISDVAIVRKLRPNRTEAEQALYDLLMEKVKTYAQERDYTVVIAPSGETKQMRGTELIEAIPVSAINKLFGRDKDGRMEV